MIDDCVIGTGAANGERFDGRPEDEDEDDDAAVDSDSSVCVWMSTFAHGPRCCNDSHSQSAPRGREVVCASREERRSW